jgi:hypothetical protein
MTQNVQDCLVLTCRSSWQKRYRAAAEARLEAPLHRPWFFRLYVFKPAQSVALLSLIEFAGGGILFRR